MMDPASLRKLLRQLSVWNAPGATCLTWEHVQIHIRDIDFNAHAHNLACISLRSWLQLPSCWLPFRLAFFTCQIVHVITDMDPATVGIL